MAKPKMTLERRGSKIVATCASCGHEISKADKKLAVEHMIGHFAGRHRENITAMLDGDITVVDNT